MNRNYYLLYGMLTLAMVFQWARSSESPDWTKQADPRDPKYQQGLLLGIAFIIFAWPLVWLMFATGDLTGKRRK